MISIIINNSVRFIRFNFFYNSVIGTYSFSDSPSTTLSAYSSQACASNSPSVSLPTPILIKHE